MKQRGKKKNESKDEDNLRDLWDNVKCPNIRIIGVPEEDKKKGHPKTQQSKQDERAEKYSEHKGM